MMGLCSQSYCFYTVSTDALYCDAETLEASVFINWYSTNTHSGNICHSPLLLESLHGCEFSILCLSLCNFIYQNCNVLAGDLFEDPKVFIAPFTKYMVINTNHITFIVNLFQVFINFCVQFAVRNTINVQ